LLPYEPGGGPAVPPADDDSDGPRMRLPSYDCDCVPAAYDGEAGDARAP
jgi:hypothetical protein